MSSSSFSKSDHYLQRLASDLDTIRGLRFAKDFYSLEEGNVIGHCKAGRARSSYHFLFLLVLSNLLELEISTPSSVIPLTRFKKELNEENLRAYIIYVFRYMKDQRHHIISKHEEFIELGELFVHLYKEGYLKKLEAFESLDIEEFLKQYSQSTKNLC